MSDQTDADKTLAQEANAKLQEHLRDGIESGRLRSYFDIDYGQLVFFKPEHSRPNPNDLRMN